LLAGKAREGSEPPYVNCYDFGFRAISRRAFAHHNPSAISATLPFIFHLQLSPNNCTYKQVFTIKNHDEH
jgi:hypothetical protein